MKGEKRVNRWLSVLVLLLVILWLIPVYYLLVSTFKTGAQVAKNPLALPASLDFSGYVKAFHDMQFPRALFNTVFISVMSVVVNLTVSTLAAYTLARRKSKINTVVYMFFLVGMMVPVQMGLSSLYRIMSTLHLVNNLFSVVLINAASSTISSIFLIKSFISSAIPLEIEEAAKIDGCGVYAVLFRIVIPLLKPVLATVSIMVMLGTWNDYLNPSLFLHSRDKGVILQEVYRNVGQFSTDWARLFPMLVLGILPLTIIYIFLQKFIISGVTQGSVKG
ncbi:MAG: carbohydrate ABC transporter permease [Lachnospiraceae bacterium]|nr:carbohydrate ABC transporter permease [Lachnospiraceae bacterium]MDY5742960.1 carbohydrate ABC transporter permease [Lachnospiraceae bacterium]